MRSVGAALIVLVPAASAAEPTRWEPGEPTTSTVKGEVAESNRSHGDGVYGRFEGDLDLGVGLGVATWSKQALGAARLSLHYHSTLGIYAGYADALGRRGETERFADLGVDLRPLFLLRWPVDAEQGPAALDLIIDSLSVGAGAFFAQPAGSDFGSARGPALSLGLGAPLIGKATGPWLEARYFLRWANPGGGDAESTDHAALLVLSWHALFFSGLGG